MSPFAAPDGASWAPGTSRAGFTLIEVLVALAILGIAFTAVLRANLQVQDSILAARRQTAATMLASAVLARIEAQGVRQWSRYENRQEQAGVRLVWRVRMDSTLAEGMRRVLVTVRAAEGERVLARREAFFPEGSG